MYVSYSSYVCLSANILLYVQCIPLVVDGKDVVAMARTGSGKTAAFLIPLFERLKTHSAKVVVSIFIIGHSVNTHQITVRYCEPSSQ